jgi:hypothetical protein
MLFGLIRSRVFPVLIILAFILPACSSVQPVASTLSPTSPQATSVSTPSSQYEIRAQDSGKTFTYTVTTRFSVILDQNQYPKSDLSCQPQGIIGSISNIPEVQPPLYAARYEAVQSGTCKLKDGSFEVTIHIIQ